MFEQLETVDNDDTLSDEVCLKLRTIKKNDKNCFRENNLWVFYNTGLT